MKMLALCFLLLIGVMLVAEGIEKHIERGYIYFAMLFALAVELLNQRTRKQHAVPDDRPAVPSRRRYPGRRGREARVCLAGDHEAPVEGVLHARSARSPHRVVAAVPTGRARPPRGTVSW